MKQAFLVYAGTTDRFSQPIPPELMCLPKSEHGKLKNRTQQN